MRRQACMPTCSCSWPLAGGLGGCTCIPLCFLAWCGCGSAMRRVFPTHVHTTPAPVSVTTCIPPHPALPTKTCRLDTYYDEPIHVSVGGGAKAGVMERMLATVDQFLASQNVGRACTCICSVCLA